MAKNPDELIVDAKFHRLAVYAIAGSFCFFFLMLTTCTMHMNSFNPEEAKMEEAEIRGEIELSKQKQAERMERLKVMEKMIIEKKVDPIAARCAIEGWNEETSNVCLAIINGTEVQTNDKN